MIYKDGKKVIPYKDDYQPVKVYKDGKLISSAEKVSDKGTSLTISSEYKTPCVKKVIGDSSQDSRVVPTYEVEGYAEVVDGIIKGAGEYKSNQLVDYNKKNLSGSSNGITWTQNADKSISVVGTATAISTNIFWDFMEMVYGNKYLIVNGLGCIVNEANGKHRVLEGNIESNYISMWNNPNNLQFVVFFRVLSGETKNSRGYLLVRNLTQLSLDHLTLDELKAQRPDLFVYQPYHETETRCGMIFSDGSVYPHEPLYGIGDVKDKQSTNGVRNGKYGTYTFTGNENWTSGGQTPKGLYRFYTNFLSDIKIASLNTGCSYGMCDKLPTYYGQYNQNDYECIRFGQNNSAIYIYLNENKTNAEIQDYIRNSKVIYELATPSTTQSTPVELPSGLSCVNETSTQVNVTTPTPQYPEEIKHTERLEINDEAIEGLDLYEGDEIIVNGKGKNLFDKFASTYSEEGYRMMNLQLKPSTRYSLSMSGRKSRNEVGFWLIQPDSTQIINRRNYIGLTTEYEYIRAFTTDSTGRVKIGYYPMNSSDGKYLDTNFILVEGSEVPTEFEPYLPNKVWLEKKVEKKKGDDIGFYYAQNSALSKGAWVCSFQDKKIGSYTNVICDVYPNSDRYTVDKTIVCNPNNQQIYIIDTNFGGSQLNDFKNFFKEHLIIYQLETSQWIDLTDTPLGQSLLNAKTTPNTEMRISVNEGVVEAEWYEAK